MRLLLGIRDHHQLSTQMTRKNVSYNFIKRTASDVNRYFSTARCDDIQSFNAASSDRLTLRQSETTLEWGVYADVPFEANSFVLRGSTLDVLNTKRTAHSIQISMKNHVLMDLPARYLNHACGSSSNLRAVDASKTAANVMHRDMDDQQMLANTSSSEWKPVYDFFATRDIQCGEQLSFDYETTEYEMQTPFECKCGSSECRGWISGFRFHADIVLRDRDRSSVAPYLLQTLHDGDGADNHDTDGDNDKGKNGSGAMAYRSFV